MLTDLNLGSQFPKQKVSFSKKGEKWGKECVDGVMNMIFSDRNTIRSTRERKRVNSNISAGIIDKKELQRFINPLDVEGTNLDELNIENKQIIYPRIQALKGEEYKRRFYWKVKVENDDAISKREIEEKKIVQKYLQESLQRSIDSGEFDEAEAQKQLAKLQTYLQYEWQDIRELSATRILNYYYKYLGCRDLFNRGFEDAIIYGEEIYCVDEFSKEPYLRKCDPRTTWYLVTGYEDTIDNCDAVLEEYYLPVGQTIDQYYDYLTPAQIDQLEEKRSGLDASLSQPELSFTQNMSSQEQFNAQDVAQYTHGTAFDFKGGIRIIHARWKSFKKVGTLTYFDEQGNERKKAVDETYKLSPQEEDLGFYIKWFWVNEAWEGTKIGSDIYIKIKPRDIQFRKKDNLSYCSLGYYGTIYNSTNNVVQSLVDIMKPYQYTYITVWHRTMEAMRKSYGKIGFIDMAWMPEGWDAEMWMYYATQTGFAVRDSFAEGKKGAATGRLAGNISGQQTELNMDQMQFINNQLQMLQFIDNELDYITGISKQRMGITEREEGLGVMQVKQQATSNITEPFFKRHDSLKLRVIAGILETAKSCLKGGSKKIADILDDLSVVTYQVEGDILNEAEYGLVMSDAQTEADTLQVLQRGAEAAFQTQTISVTEFIDILTDDSISSKRRKLEKSQNEKIAREQQANQQQLETQKAIADQQYQLEIMKMELDRYIADLRAETEITKAEILVFMKEPTTDSDNNGVPDVMEIAKHGLEIQKQLSDNNNKILDREIEKEITDKEAKIKEREIELKKKSEDNKKKVESDKLKMEKFKENNRLRIEKLKAETAIKVAKYGDKGKIKK